MIKIIVGIQQSQKGIFIGHNVEYEDETPMETMAGIAVEHDILESVMLVQETVAKLGGIGLVMLAMLAGEESQKIVKDAQEEGKAFVNPTQGDLLKAGIGEELLKRFHEAMGRPDLRGEDVPEGLRDLLNKLGDKLDRKEGEDDDSKDPS